MFVQNYTLPQQQALSWHLFLHGWSLLPCWTHWQQCKKESATKVQFWTVKGVLLRSICQRPIKANSTGQAVLAAIEGFSQNAHWQNIVFSLCKKAAIVEWWRSKEDIGFCFGSVVYYEVFKGYFLVADIQMELKRNFWWKEGREGELGGYRCVCISLNMEPLCTNFLLSFWKVGSRSEAISRVFSPCWCVLMWALLVLMGSPFQTGGRGSAETAHKRKGWGLEKSLVNKRNIACVCVLLIIKTT